MIWSGSGLGRNSVGVWSGYGRDKVGKSWGYSRDLVDFKWEVFRDLLDIVGKCRDPQCQDTLEGENGDVAYLRFSK